MTSSTQGTADAPAHGLVIGAGALAPIRPTLSSTALDRLSLAVARLLLAVEEAEARQAAAEGAQHHEEAHEC